MKKRSDGRYTVKRKINGKYVYFYGKTKEEALKKADVFQEAAMMPPTFAEMAQKWKDEEWESMSFTTQKGYTAAYNRAVEHFGDMQLDEITTPIINQYLHGFISKKYALKTVQKHRSVVSLIFDHAIISGDATYNPVRDVKLKKGLPRGKREAASDDDIRRIAHSDDEWLFPQILLFTGMRKSEALALTYEDFDFDKKTVTVNKTLLFDSNRPVRVNKTKTAAGTRQIPVPELLLSRIPRDKTGIMFDYDYRQYRNAWNAYCKRVGVSCTPHQLRHAYASILYDAGLREKEAQSYLGHADIQTTQNIYTHLLKSRTEQAQKTITDYVANHFEK